LLRERFGISRYLLLLISSQELINYTQDTFASIGPFATWERVHDISAAVPVLGIIKDHVNIQSSSILIGKKHTTPSAELDICNLASAYHISKAHLDVPGRRVKSKECKTNKFSDWVNKGAAELGMKVKTWSAERFTVRGTDEIPEAFLDKNN
jgi:hypothetical protein